MPFTKTIKAGFKGLGYADLDKVVSDKPESAYRLSSITKFLLGFDELVVGSHLGKHLSHVL